MTANATDNWLADFTLSSLTRSIYDSTLFEEEDASSNFRAFRAQFALPSGSFRRAAETHVSFRLRAASRNRSGFRSTGAKSPAIFPRLAPIEEHQADLYLRCIVISISERRMYCRFKQKGCNICCFRETYGQNVIKMFPSQSDSDIFREGDIQIQ